MTGTARNFEYNADNALVVATDSSGGRQEMMPDSLERLHRYYDGSANRWLLYDGHRLIAETNSSANAIARRYVHGPGTDEPLVWYEGSGTSDRRWLHADERGSAVAASDGSGNLAGSINRYDDYGTPQGGSLTGRFGYSGQAWLPAPGLYDYRARFYNPALGGRFMQTDPIGYGGGMNMYAYVGNNPVNFTDPWGLDCPDPNTCVTVTGTRPQNPPTTRTFFSMGHTHVVNLTEREFFSRVGGREPDCDEPSAEEEENCIVVTGNPFAPPPSPPQPENFYPPMARDLFVPAEVLRPSTQCSGWGVCPPPPTREEICRIGRANIELGTYLMMGGAAVGGVRNGLGRAAVTAGSRAGGWGIAAGAFIRGIGEIQIRSCR